jgi:hypothetical protein
MTLIAGLEFPADNTRERIEKRYVISIPFEVFQIPNLRAQTLLILEIDKISMKLLIPDKQAYCKLRSKCEHKKIEMQVIIHKHINFFMDL